MGVSRFTVSLCSFVTPRHETEASGHIAVWQRFLLQQSYTVYVSVAGGVTERSNSGVSAAMMTFLSQQHFSTSALEGPVT